MLVLIEVVSVLLPETVVPKQPICEEVLHLEVSSTVVVSLLGKDTVDATVPALVTVKLVQILLHGVLTVLVSLLLETAGESVQPEYIVMLPLLLDNASELTFPTEVNELLSILGISVVLTSDTAILGVLQVTFFASVGNA